MFKALPETLLERFIIKEEDPVLTLVFRILFFLGFGLRLGLPLG